MRFFAWLRRQLTVRALPFIIGGVIAAVGASAWWGYNKGFTEAERRYFAAMNKALQEQHERMLAQVQRETRREGRRDRTIREIRDRAGQVADPARCELHPDCMRFYVDILRATTTDP